MQYDAGGRRTRQAWADGFFVTYEYDQAGAMTAVRENGGLALASYGHDAGSRLQSLTQDLVGGAWDLALGFGYNPAGQIATRTSSNDTYAFTGHYTVDRPYAVNGLNQYTSAGSVAFGYDGRGNLTGDGTSGWGYNTRNQLYTNNQGQLFYRNPVGLLNHVIANGQVTNFDYVGADLATEFDGNTVKQRYVYGPGTDEPLLWYDNGSRRYLHADERGSVIAVSDDAGNATAINRYDEYGIPAAGNVGRFGYTGQKWIPELGLYDYKARMYSPTLGRFMQTDPIGYADGLNWYNYVGGDPVNATDPTGLMKMVCENKMVWVDRGSEIVGTSHQVCGWQYEASDFAPPDRSYAPGVGETGAQPQSQQPVCPAPSASRAPASRRHSSPNWTRPGWQVLYKTFAGYRSLSRSGYGHNDASDAWRHFRWSFSMAQTMGDTAARDFLEHHERAEPNPPGEAQMDAANNAMGLAFANDPRYADLDPDVAANFALRRGCLQTGTR